MTPMKILVTGSAGVIGSYLVAELLPARHEGVGPAHLGQAGYRFVEGNATDTGLMHELMRDVDHVVAGAARIGGISYFHEYAYDLLAENERITAATFDAAIQAHQKGKLQKITVISSSMVFENA